MSEPMKYEMEYFRYINNLLKLITPKANSLIVFDQANQTHNIPKSLNIYILMDSAR